jgi:hypothetical protein
VDELGAEGNVHVHELRLTRRGSEPRHGAEAVEVPGAARRGVEVDRVTAAEEAGHHRLGDARRERGRDRRVGGAAAVGEDLGARVRGRGMARSDARSDRHQRRGSTNQPMRAKPSRGKSSRWLINVPPAKPYTPPPSGRAS